MVSGDQAVRLLVDSWRRSAEGDILWPRCRGRWQLIRVGLGHARNGRAKCPHLDYCRIGMTDAAVTSSSHHEPASALIARTLPLHAAVYGTLWAIAHPGAATKTMAVVLWGAAIFALRFRAARAVSFVSCVLLTGLVFPLVPNHGYVFCLALLIGMSFQTTLTDERTCMVEAFRNLAGIVWFWSGVQKAWAGTWTHGQLLAYEIGHSRRFGHMLGWLTTRSELRALRNDGPFWGNATLTVLGQSMWILEICVGIGLLVAPLRVRKYCVWVAIGLLLGIEVVARESVFGILMLALLVPSLDIQLRARYLWLLVPIELLAIGGRLSIVPGGFH